MFNEKASNYLKLQIWAEKHIKRKKTKNQHWSTMAPGQDTFKTNACILMLTLVRNHPNTFLQSHWALPHQENPVSMLPLQVGLHSHISHDFSWTFLPGLGGQHIAAKCSKARNSNLDYTDNPHRWGSSDTSAIPHPKCIHIFPRLWL